MLQAQSQVPTADTISLESLWRFTRRNLLWLAAIFAAVNGLCFWLAETLPPAYTANATIVLDTRAPRVAPVQSVLSPLEATAAVVMTELTNLRSPDLTQRVIDRIGSEAAAGVLLTTPHPTRDINFLPHVIKLFKVDDVAPQPTVPEIENQMVDDFQSRLKLYNESGSYSIQIGFVSESPELATLVANAYADEYIRMLREQSREAAKNASLWLEDRLTDLRSKVAQAKRDLQQFQSDTRLVETGGITVSGQQLSELNSKLIQARTDVNIAQARYRRILELVQSGRSETAPEVLDSSVIQGLKEKQSALLGKKAEMSMQYGERHPTIVNLNAELDDVRRLLDDEIQRIIERSANELQVANTRERDLEGELDSLQEKVSQDSRSQLIIEDLRREVEVSQKIYEDFLTRYKETANADDSPGVKLMALARVPLAPSSPNKPLIVALGSIASLLLCAVIALIGARIPQPIRSGSELMQRLSLTMLGLMPFIKARKAGGIQSHLLQYPRSAQSEALNALFTKIELARGPDDKCVLVTSGLPNEGKTSLVLGLSLIAARGGRRICILDLDLKRRGLSRVYMPSSEARLVSTTDNTHFTSEIWEDPVNGITTVMIHPTAEGEASHRLILGSMELKWLISRIRSTADLILIDSPPVLAVGDAIILGSIVDLIVIAVRWGQSTIEEIRQVLLELSTHESKIAGAALTVVDLDKHRAYGFKDTGSYYNLVKKYYAHRR